MLFDLKILRSAVDQLEQEKNISKEKTIEAIEMALAAAYKKEYGRKGQIVRAHFDAESGATEFYQVKVVVDDTIVDILEEGEEPSQERIESEEHLPHFNEEHHILLEDARKIKKDVELEEELVFPLEEREDFGRIAAQTAKQVIIQKIREAERSSILDEFGQRERQIVSGTVQRVERGNMYVDLGKAVGTLGYDDQIPKERYRQGERVRAYLYSVDEGSRGVTLKLSRSHPKFVEKLFEAEAPEIINGSVEVKAIAREPGSRTKMAVYSNDPHIDPIGSCVGQRGVRVSTVMSELGGEKIDIIEWSDDAQEFISDSLAPAIISHVEVDEETHTAHVSVAPDQLSLAIGRGGQNARLAAKLSGWKIDIQALGESEHTEIEPSGVIHEISEEENTTTEDEQTPANEVESEKMSTEDGESHSQKTDTPDSTETNEEDTVAEEKK